MLFVTTYVQPVRNKLLILHCRSNETYLNELTLLFWCQVHGTYHLLLFSDVVVVSGWYCGVDNVVGVVTELGDKDGWQQQPQPPPTTRVQQQLVLVLRTRWNSRTKEQNLTCV